ncbi:MAG: diaminopimelate epimerase [Xanthomonadaceae bacterium]|jgi:diaminopimelate epimerase|nr:diaminopimelate epimerase [Xanthomonadaceae bacterium]
MTEPLHFSKMQGAGNDFVVLDLRRGGGVDAALAAALADRHSGVGCDQILTIEPPCSENALALYRVWNADGSEAGQCGNGARCVAAWLVRDGAAQRDRFLLDSPSGLHRVERLADGRYSVSMGLPRFAPAEIPMAGIDTARNVYLWRDDVGEAHFGAVSMGNPHAVIEVPDAGKADAETVGPWLQRSPMFPQSCNVGFAEVVDRGHIRLRVYERGSGETLACGSGACAAAVVLMRRDRLDRHVTVSLPGGDLSIEWPADDAEVIMTGPATFVFEGDWIA